jgi:hypothetical protein
VAGPGFPDSGPRGPGSVAVAVRAAVELGRAGHVAAGVARVGTPSRSRSDRPGDLALLVRGVEGEPHAAEDAPRLAPVPGFAESGAAAELHREPVGEERTQAGAGGDRGAVAVRGEVVAARPPAADLGDRAPAPGGAERR